MLCTLFQKDLNLKGNGENPRPFEITFKIF